MIAGLVMACKGRFWGGMAMLAFFGLNLASGHPYPYYSAFIMLALLVVLHKCPKDQNPENYL